MVPSAISMLRLSPDAQIPPSVSFLELSDKNNDLLQIPKYFELNLNRQCVALEPIRKKVFLLAFKEVSQAHNG